MFMIEKSKRVVILLIAQFCVDLLCFFALVYSFRFDKTKKTNATKIVTWVCIVCCIKVNCKFLLYAFRPINVNIITRKMVF